MGKALVADVPEQPQPLLLDLRLAPRLEDRARAEAERALADLPPGNARQRLAFPADVGEQREDEIVRLGDQLLDDRVEAVLVRAAPSGDGGVGVERDDRLLAERERELLAFRRLDEERRLQAGRADRLLVAREHRCRRGHARGGALDG